MCVPPPDKQVSASVKAKPRQKATRAGGSGAGNEGAAESHTPAPREIAAAAAMVTPSVSTRSAEMSGTRSGKAGSEDNGQAAAGTSRSGDGAGVTKKARAGHAGNAGHQTNGAGAVDDASVGDSENGTGEVGGTHGDVSSGPEDVTCEPENASDGELVASGFVDDGSDIAEDGVCRTQPPAAADTPVTWRTDSPPPLLGDLLATAPLPPPPSLHDVLDDYASAALGGEVCRGDDGPLGTPLTTPPLLSPRRAAGVPANSSTGGNAREEASVARLLAIPREQSPQPDMPGGRGTDADSARTVAPPLTPPVERLLRERRLQREGVGGARGRALSPQKAALVGCLTTVEREQLLGLLSQWGPLPPCLLFMQSASSSRNFAS